jgi:hypothetical protein
LIFRFENAVNGFFASVAAAAGEIFPVRDAAGTGAFAGAAATPLAPFPLVGTGTDRLTPEADALSATGTAGIATGAGAD